MEARLHTIHSLEDMCTINTCYQFSFNPLFFITVLSFHSHTSTKLSMSTHQVVYLNHGTLSANSLSNAFCSSVNSLAPISSATFSLLLFSLAHHVDMNSVNPNAMLYAY
jgi:hypothetical protein